jgi:hypothetical protein
VTRRGGMVMSVGGDATPGRVKGGDDANWVNMNLAGQMMLDGC